MQKTKCNSKNELILVLKNWLKTNEQSIGNGENKTGHTKWIFLNLNGNKYYINADTTREGIMYFLENHENNYPWVVIANKNNVYNKVSNGKSENAIKGLYFYSVTYGKKVI